MFNALSAFCLGNGFESRWAHQLFFLLFFLLLALLSAAREGQRFHSRFHFQLIAGMLVMIWSLVRGSVSVMGLALLGVGLVAELVTALLW